MLLCRWPLLCEMEHGSLPASCKPSTSCQPKNISQGLMDQRPHEPFCTACSPGATASCASWRCLLTWGLLSCVPSWGPTSSMWVPPAALCCLLCGLPCCLLCCGGAVLVSCRMPSALLSCAPRW